MTLTEFLFALETAVREDNRWALRELDSACKSRLRKDAVRHADNLVFAEKTGSDDIAEYSRANLAQAIKRLKDEQAKEAGSGDSQV